MPILSIGSRGKRVVVLQDRLLQLGYTDVAQDGFFDEATQSAVADIQARHVLPVDGNADRLTYALIVSGYAVPRPKLQQENIDEDEMDHHFAYLQRVAVAPEETERRTILAEGFMEFGPRLLSSAGHFVKYCDSVLVDPRTSSDLREGLESQREGLETLREAYSTFMDWLGGISFTERADEADRRARVGMMVLDEMGLAGLARRAVRAVLALPDAHPDRNVEWARDTIVAHLHRSRLRGEPDEIVETIATIISNDLVHEEQALRLIAEGGRLATSRLDKQGQREFWAAVAGYSLVQASAEQQRIQDATDPWLPNLEEGQKPPDRGRFAMWRGRARRAFKRMDALSRRFAPGDRKRVSMKNTLGLAALYSLDQPRKSAGMLRIVLESKALDGPTLREAARLEAKLRLQLDDPTRVLELLRPRIDAFERRYLAAVEESDVTNAGEDYEEVVSALAFASARVGRWDRTVHYLARPLGLRLRHRAALRRSSEGTTIVDLERRLFAVSRRLETTTAVPRRPRQQDWVGLSLREGTHVLEEYRRQRTDASVRLRHPRLRDIAARLRPREALAVFGVSHAGLLIAVVCPGDRTQPCGRFLLTEWPMTRLLKTLMGPELDGWVMALGGRVSPPLDPHEPLERLLKDLEPIGATLGAFAKNHGVEHLTLMLDPWLDFVPLWALPGLKDMDVSVASNASRFTSGQQADSLVLNHALIVGDPTHDLPASMAEEAVVSQRLEAHGVSVERLSREKATVDAVVKGLASAEVLHFAGHGRSVLSAPLESALELQPDWGRIPVENPAAFLELLGNNTLAWQQPFTEMREATVPGIGHIRQLTDSDNETYQAWLDYNDIRTLWGFAEQGQWSRVSELWTAGTMMVQGSGARMRVAFLSACSSGGASMPTAAGPSGLIAALQLAGVAAVISTRWDIKDGLTALFVDLFYETLERVGTTGTLAHVVREASASLREMRREAAVTRLGQIQQATADRRALFALRVFVKSLEAAAEYPFRHPLDWAAFYVAGEGTMRVVLPGTIHADAPVPSEKR